MTLIRLTAAALLLAATPLVAQMPGEKPKNTGQKAVDTVISPLRDLNLKRDEIPAVLLKASENAYDLKGLRRCGAVTAAIAELDAVLGPDFDVPTDRGKRRRGEDLAFVAADSFIGTLIPFRGLIREISGAKKAQREALGAVFAGVARRSYLKGVAKQRGCKLPPPPVAPPVENDKPD
ncbi:MAG: hypothetical protein INF91_03195 [Alphaproteobacteria bacterium]|nr:hypothetical protein [Alphaproteobacteria bacterium]